MHRGPRQKRSGAEQDWCLKWWRRAYGLNERPGRGKYSKRAMARRRRREWRREARSSAAEPDEDDGPSISAESVTDVSGMTMAA